MINFSRAFDLAWERMAVILFRPFQTGKWFTIGFSAFLAGFLAGGNGFNGSYRQGDFDRTNWSASYHANNLQQLNSNVSSALAGLQGGFLVLLVAVAVVFILGFILLMYWLGARGQFLFLDNVVRNRGAIAWPWRAYVRQANSLLGFCLLWLLGVMIVLLPFIVVGIFEALPLFRQHRWPAGAEIPLFVLLGLAYLAVTIPLAVLFFLFRELGVPLMFRHGLLARAAFGEMWRLVRAYPGPIALFVLLRIALAIGLAIVSVLVCCLSCCLGAVPYLGTVLILPALVYIKCFTLDFLAQFGPQYDVWTVDVPAAPLSPPPPPG